MDYRLLILLLFIFIIVNIIRGFSPQSLATFFWYLIYLFLLFFFFSDTTFLQDPKRLSQLTANITYSISLLGMKKDRCSHQLA